MVTRLYVEGEYNDGGYVGIDEVNPTGLPFLMDFSYFRELGVFSQTHEDALAVYLRDIVIAKAGSAGTTGQLIQLDGQLNALWGQIDYVLFVVESGTVVRTICGGAATPEQAEITQTDVLTVLWANGTYGTQEGGAFDAETQYAVKFI